MIKIIKIDDDYYARLKVPDDMTLQFSKNNQLVKLKATGDEFTLADNQSDKVQALYMFHQDLMKSLRVSIEPVQCAVEDVINNPAVLIDDDIEYEEITISNKAFTAEDLASMPENELAAVIGALRYRAIIPEMISRNFRREYLLKELSPREKEKISFEWSEDGQPTAINLTTRIENWAKVNLSLTCPQGSYAAKLETDVFKYCHDEISAKVASDIWPIIERNQQSIAA